MKVLVLYLVKHVPSHDFVPKLVVFLADHERCILSVIEPCCCLHLILMLDLLEHLPHHLFFIKSELADWASIPRVLEDEVSLLVVSWLVLYVQACFVVHEVLVEASCSSLLALGLHYGTSPKGVGLPELVGL